MTSDAAAGTSSHSLVGVTFCVELDRVTKTFGATRALDGLSLRAEQGTITAVLGPNGAGKTTATAICEGLEQPDSGTVRVLGLDPRRDAAQLRPRVGVMIQDGGLPVMARAEELLRHIARMYARPRDPGKLINSLGLAPFARTSVRRLSGGQRQRLALAIALVGRPDLVFLDEPSAGLDPHARLAVWALIEKLRAEGVSVLLTTHLMDEASRLADQVVIIDHGRVIASGTLAELTEISAVDGGARLGPDAHHGEQAEQAEQPEGPPATSRVLLEGELTAAAMSAVEQVARTHALTLSRPLEAAPPPERPTLEDIFLQLTGRSLR